MPTLSSSLPTTCRVSQHAKKSTGPCVLTGIASSCLERVQSLPRKKHVSYIPAQCRESYRGRVGMMVQERRRDLEVEQTRQAMTTWWPARGGPARWLQVLEGADGPDLVHSIQGGCVRGKRGRADREKRRGEWSSRHRGRDAERAWRRREREGECSSCRLGMHVLILFLDGPCADRLPAYSSDVSKRRPLGTTRPRHADRRPPTRERHGQSSRTWGTTPLSSPRPQELASRSALAWRRFS